MEDIPPIRKSKELPPLPDEMEGSPIYTTLPTGERIVSGHVIIRPNDPAPPHEPVEDRRPHTLFPPGIESAEEWGNKILSQQNGGATQRLKDELNQHARYLRRP